MDTRRARVPCEILSLAAIWYEKAEHGSIFLKSAVGFEAKRMMFLIVDWLPPGDTHFLKLCFYPFIGERFCS